MKKVLFSEKFQKRLMDVCMYGIIICVLGFFTLRNRADMLEISPDSAYYLFIPVVPMVIYCYLYFASKLPVSRYYFFGEITKIDHRGFKIGNVLDDAHRRILWEDVKTVKLDEYKEYLEVYFKRGNLIQIRKDVDHFYKLLQEIPKEFTEFDLKETKRSFRNAKTCPCCGYIALVDDECVQCYHMTWDEEVDTDYPNAEVYLRHDQLKYFSTIDEDDPVEFYPEEEHYIFKFDRRWKPSVTEEEVIAYSKENEWGNY